VPKRISPAVADPAPVFVVHVDQLTYRITKLPLDIP
jgi:hypothetical protein